MKTIIKENLKFEVNHINDTYMDPRQDFNLGTMFCLHKKYNIGDKHNYSGNDFSSWKEVKKFLKEEEEAIIILPLFAYDHGLFSLSTTPFNCNFDSGQVGYIYVTEEDVLKEYGLLTKKIKNKVKNLLEEEVKIYNFYLTGETYNVTVYQDSEEIDCFNVYGYEEIENFINYYKL